MCWWCFCIILNKKIIIFEYYEYIKSRVFSTCYEYVIRVTTFFQCALLIELNTVGMNDLLP